MPELPEIETMRKGVEPVVGSRIVRVCFPRCRFKPNRTTPSRATFRRRSETRRIAAAQRFGKRVALRLDSGDALVFEPRMTGLVLLAEPPDREHLRFGLELDGGTASRLWYWDRRGLGSVQLLSPQQLQMQFRADRLGPDALSITVQQLRTRLDKSRRAIKVALLDQRAVAGIGNIYDSEVLHVARIDPAKRCDWLSRAAWHRLHTALKHILQEAIQYEGSTLADGTYRNALNRTGRYQNHHRVYAREGKLCRSCQHGRIRRIVQGQRSTFFWPRCQPS